MTDKEKILAIVETMDNWDLDTLISWARDVREEMLSRCTSEEINQTYITELPWNFPILRMPGLH